MSQVISFRLNPNNPREAEALAILDARLRDGFTLRQVMVEALLCLGSGAHQEMEPVVNSLHEALSEAQALLALLQSGQSASPISRAEEHLTAELPDGFLVSVKNAAKPGMRAR